MKKYVPSGYQIIDIELPNTIESGDSIEPTTEDEKLLHSLLSNGKISKPILLHLKTKDYNFTGFGILSGGTISISDSTTTMSLTVNDEYLDYELVEE